VAIRRSQAPKLREASKRARPRYALQNASTSTSSDALRSSSSGMAVYRALLGGLAEGSVGERYVAVTLVLWLATHCQRPSRMTKTST